MLNHTLDQLSELKLHGIKSAVLDRHNRRIIRMMQMSKLKYKQACLNDIDYHTSRNLNRGMVGSLAENHWIENRHNVIITGPTGTGKTWLACALAVNGIGAGHSALYVRVSHLMSEVLLVRTDGSYLNWLKRISRFSVLILDDFGLSSLSTQQAQELLEVIEERTGTGSCIVTSQLPVREWYSYFKNPTVADAIMDRLVHNAYRIELKGDSMRKNNAVK